VEANDELNSAGSFHGAESVEDITEEEYRKIALKKHLLEYFESDLLYQKLDGIEIFSDEITSLNIDSRYGSTDVAKILNKCELLYDKEKREPYVKDASRLRWWLSETRDDNLLLYLQVEKVADNWSWDIYGICRAKIVALLRYVKGYSQRQIKAEVMGLKTTAPRNKAFPNDVDGFLQYIREPENTTMPYDTLVAGVKAFVEATVNDLEKKDMLIEKQDEKLKAIDRELSAMREMATTSRNSEQIHRHFDTMLQLTQYQMLLRKWRSEAVELYEKDNGWFKKLKAGAVGLERYVSEYVAVKEEEYRKKTEEEFKEKNEMLPVSRKQHPTELS
jgi:hypothetical protein